MHSPCLQNLRRLRVYLGSAYFAETEIFFTESTIVKGKILAKIV